jgi:hypothetical protein
VSAPAGAPGTFTVSGAYSGTVFEHGAGLDVALSWARGYERDANVPVERVAELAAGEMWASHPGEGIGLQIRRVA